MKIRKINKKAQAHQSPSRAIYDNKKDNSEQNNKYTVRSMLTDLDKWEKFLSDI